MQGWAYVHSIKDNTYFQPCIPHQSVLRGFSTVKLDFERAGCDSIQKASEKDSGGGLGLCVDLDSSCPNALRRELSKTLD